MSLFIAFGLAFIFSFIGTIPPGTLNLSVLQLGLENKLKAAWQFSIAASLMEYPYCWLAIRFEKFITSSPTIVENFERIGAVVMLVFGILNLFSLRKQHIKKVDAKEYGFTKGLVLGILNPLAMPYWIAITAYLKSQHWLVLNTVAELQGYLLGVVLGALSFFMVAAYLANRVAVYLKGNSVLKYIPAIMLIVLGLYGLIHSLG
jgi:threonine/homoserine/homoserine lactone efflux protein